MKQGAALLCTLAMAASACSLPSFEERQAELDREEAEATTTSDDANDDGDGDGGETSSPPTTAPEDPVVLGGDDPTADLPDPAWTELELEGNVIATFEQPIALIGRSGSNDLYVAERAGFIRRISRTFTSRGLERISSNTRLVLDISDQVSLDGEQGLLDIEFSLDGRSLYVSYTDLSGDSVIAEYDIARSTRANAGSRRELLRVPQPFTNHNGGKIEIGSDGFLYIGLGDGGSSGDPEGNGQDTTTLLGAVLRIDPVAIDEQPYLVPDGNPFVDGGGAAEIFLYGVRNPWQFSFDPANGDLWLADVGQNDFEEINHLAADDGGGRGANLGWAAMEAFEPFDGGSEPSDHTRPIYAYPHTSGRCSITGGVVYRGEVMPLLDGVYLFGDYCTGELFGLARTPEGPMVRPFPLVSPENQLVAFGVANDGEVYIVQAGGDIVRIEPAEQTADG